MKATEPLPRNGRVSISIPLTVRVSAGTRRPVGLRGDHAVLASCCRGVRTSLVGTEELERLPEVRGALGCLDARVVSNAHQGTPGSLPHTRELAEE
ncbi:hypothetical protein MRX96_001155 [Rhipicephalus microplus]